MSPAVPFHVTMQTALAIWLAAAPAAAGTDAFQAYLNSATHASIRAGVALRQLRTICPDRPALDDVPAASRVIQAVAMGPGDRFPASGVWEERLVGAGCGDGRQLNLLFAAQGADRPPNGTAMFPGTTHANWFLQQQAMRPAAVAASRKAPQAGCRRYAVADTDGGAAPPETPGPGDAWTERWRLRACEDFVEITITFSVPTAGGIAIDAE